MNLQLKELSDRLEDRKIKPTFQRIKVLEYLLNNPCHPTVDMIYKDLHREIPTLSKTTIYNTMNLFLETGLVVLLNIEDIETRYDIVTETHGHFKCEECGFISNFSLEIEKMASDDLIGFKITDRNVYFKGVCPKCLLNVNQKQ